MGLRQERFASESCRSTSGPDVVDDNYIRPATHRDRPEARRACDRSSCGTRSGRTRRAQCDESSQIPFVCGLSRETGVPPLTNAVEGTAEACFPEEIAPRPDYYIFLQRPP